jgi:surface carbohydrate biosynthesis protein
MDKMTDFLINYEHKARELDSICLIKLELEARGYSVELTCTYDKDRATLHPKRREAKVVITSALYNDGSLDYFVFGLAGFCKKIVNLQWEQALSNRDEENLSLFLNPKGLARNALHLCWGPATKSRLVNSGLNSRNVVTTGPIQMDTLRPEFNNLFLSKDQLAQQYNLDSKLEWVLFISSFTYITMTEEEYSGELKVLGPSINEFLELSRISKDEILSWIEEAAVKYPNKIFIYRPHPSENNDPSIAELEMKHSNFRSIGELSIKQWIKSSEKILSWYSTSAAEIYFSNKNFHVLRPVSIPFSLDLSIYRNVKVINDLEQFIAQLDADNNDFPLNKDIITQYFQVTSDRPAFKTICDLLVKVIETHEYDMPRYSIFYIFKRTFIMKFYRFAYYGKFMLSKINYNSILFWSPYLISRVEHQMAVLNRLEADRPKNQASLDELHSLEEKLRRILAGGGGNGIVS